MAIIAPRCGQCSSKICPPPLYPIHCPRPKEVLVFVPAELFFWGELGFHQSLGWKSTSPVTFIFEFTASFWFCRGASQNSQNHPPDGNRVLPRGNSSLHQVMLHGLSSLPEGRSVNLVSRSEPSSALIRLRANHLMDVLGWDQLRVTAEESEAMGRLGAPKKIPKETIRHLLRVS